VILALGIADGYKINFIRNYPPVSQPNHEIFHIGGVSQKMSTSSLWNFRGSYLWRRCLEECPDVNLQSYYKRVYGDISIKELLESNSVFSGYQSIKEFFDFVEYKIFEIT